MARRKSFNKNNDRCSECQDKKARDSNLWELGKLNLAQYQSNIIKWKIITMVQGWFEIKSKNARNPHRQIDWGSRYQV